MVILLELLDTFAYSHKRTLACSGLRLQFGDTEPHREVRLSAAVEAEVVHGQDRDGILFRDLPLRHVEHVVHACAAASSKSFKFLNKTRPTK